MRNHGGDIESLSSAMHELQILDSCFMCFQSLSEYEVVVDMHDTATSKWSHKCHKECIDKYINQGSGQLQHCPLCQGKSEYIQQVIANTKAKFEEILGVHNKKSSFETTKDWYRNMRLFFILMRLSRDEVFLYLFSQDSKIKMPRPDTELAKDLVMLLRSAFLSEGLQSTEEGRKAILRFPMIMEADPMFFLLSCRLESRRSDRYYLLPSFKYSERFAWLFETYTVKGTVHFYSHTTRPSPYAIQLINYKFGHFSEYWMTIQLLEEALFFQHLNDWIFWSVLLEAKKIPLEHFQKCILLALQHDFPFVIKWISENFNLSFLTLQICLFLAESWQSSNCLNTIKDAMMEKFGMIIDYDGPAFDPEVQKIDSIEMVRKAKINCKSLLGKSLAPPPLRTRFVSALKWKLEKKLGL